ncbi:LPS export ABC transporter periplasmic protein LptC [Sphingomonas oleivorans]|uniref:LPS export ABC transporter periplasmic protein LptC n=1 Tax=Sphingomonas oleivorans TaxID=1735121 RepID=A0A2T5FX81_9SPHN|nr:LPS export ABC transporter periplasmic protein LptC [Sphingomonas oleivorans]PTQ10739.1 LPS export ABC transporter periplasmic protein LptC [Sphingomonas oleivorans]
MSELADKVRTRRQLWAAAGSSHDRVIRTVRILLPLSIAGLATVLALAPLTMGRDISFVLAKDRVEVARERMRVSRAVYRGEDAKGQPFQLSAASAVQVTSRDPVVRLDTLSAQIALADGPATINAPKGRYDMSSERVAVDGPVLFNGPDGYHVETRDVTVDLKSRRVTSSGAVDGRMPLGTFSANQLRADLNNRIVILDGRARLHIVQGQSRGAR